MSNPSSKTTNASELVQGTSEWRHEVLRLAAECERLGISAAAFQLRMAEFVTTSMDQQRCNRMAP